MCLTLLNQNSAVSVTLLTLGGIVDTAKSDSVVLLTPLGQNSAVPLTMLSQRGILNIFESSRFI
jgi:hypothetical protein